MKDDNIEIPVKTTVLPEIISWEQLEQAQLEERPEIIEGVLRAGCKLGIAGAAKAKKTFLLLALACAVATGTTFLDKLKTSKGPVLFVNLELHPDTLRNRIALICEALELDLDEVRQNLHILNLRPYAKKNFDELVPALIESMNDLGQNRFRLCILDPLYKILGRTNENDSGAVTFFMNSLDQICIQTGASVAMSMHYGKGNQSGRQEGDRARGSSVFFGDLDALIECVEQSESDKKQGKDVLVVQFPGLREFKPQPDFCIEWDGRAVFHSSEHDPKKMKQTAGQRKYSPDQVLDVLRKSAKPLGSTDWQKLAKAEIGIGKTQFYELKNELFISGKLDYSRETELYFPLPAGAN